MNPKILKEYSPEWVAWLRAEAKRVREQKNKPDLRLVEDVLETWRLNRPKMWKRLRGRVWALPLALILQDYYQQEIEELERAGMPPTDAREEAMADWLMMASEESEELEEMDPDEARAKAWAEWLRMEPE